MCCVPHHLASSSVHMLRLILSSATGTLSLWRVRYRIGLAPLAIDFFFSFEGEFAKRFLITLCRCCFFYTARGFLTTASANFSISPWFGILAHSPQPPAAPYAPSLKRRRCLPVENSGRLPKEEFPRQQKRAFFYPWLIFLSPHWME